MFERFHEALDVDPRPGGYERMRNALIKKTYAPRRRAAFHARWTKMGFRLAAVIALIAVAVTAGAVVFATHRVAQQDVPARLDPQAVAYQTTVGSDGTAMIQSESNHCGTIDDAGCPAALGTVKAALQKWLGHLEAYATPPSGFAIIDLEMRTHLTAAMSDIDEAVLAFQAKKSAAMVSAIDAAAQEANWLGSTSVAVAHARPVTAASYVASVRGSKTLLDSCTFCRQLVSQSAASCAGNPYPSCDLEVVTSKQTMATVQDGIVATLAPDSEKAEDAQLQNDLARAENALIALRKALRTGDLPGWDLQRAAFGAALVAVNRDYAAILGS
ncbi:MAG TPA: hypothetical protein VEU76_03135 [Candidatus Udaeobacter sp.]|nr:hypothetical protein [Candidatus Udaeobacter sp.]